MPEHKDSISSILERLGHRKEKIMREHGWGQPVADPPSSPVDFSKIAFPPIRRVQSGLIANDIVSVQPMSMPAGALFYLDYTYGNSVWRQLRKAGLKRK